ncbi:MAG: T9SS type A sorting domain-containing protein [Calditrichaeota bacterium]|nr:T9SS type A sorting domain-containing protein [Calditrichota bacterium]
MKNFILFVPLVALLLFAPEAVAQDSSDVTCIKRMYNSWGYICDLVVNDEIVYAITYGSRGYGQNSELHLLDISDPLKPFDEKLIFLPTSEPISIKLENDHLYINCNEGLIIFNIEAPLRPNIVNFLRDYNGISSVEVLDTLAYIGTYDSTFIVLNVSDPSSPEEIGILDSGIQIKCIIINDQTAYLSGDQFQSVDISNLARPRQIGRCDRSAGNFIIIEENAYLAAGEEGVRVIDISEPDDLQEIGHYRMNAVDLAEWDNQLYVSYVLIEYDDGMGGEYYYPALVKLDVSNPCIPTRSGQIGTYWMREEINFVTVEDNTLYIGESSKLLILPNIENTNIRATFQPLGYLDDLELRNNYLFLGTSWGEMRIIDVEDPTQAFEWGGRKVHNGGSKIDVQGRTCYTGISRIKYLKILDVNQIQFPEIGSLYLEREHRNRRFENVVVKDDFAYVLTSGDSSGICIINVRSPENMHEVAHLTTNTSVVEAIISGDYLYLAAGNDGFLIIDVSNPEQPQIVAQYETPGRPNGFSIDGDLLYVVDGNLRIFDVSDAEGAEEVTFCEIDGNASDIKLSGDFAYIASHQVEDGPSSGIYIYDKSNPSDPHLVGYYLTYGQPQYLAVSPPYVFSSERCHLAIYDCSEALGIDKDDQAFLAQEFRLLPAFPNPFNSTTTIKYSLPFPSHVSLQVYNTLGQQVKSLFEGCRQPGFHYTVLNAVDLPSGLYFVRLETSEQVFTQKIMLIR